LGICLYDRRAFRADLLRQVAEAHPAMTGPGAEADWAPLLRIRRTVDPYGLRLTGEADLSNRRALAAALDAVLDQQPDRATPILIDVAELRFADADTAGLLGRLALQAPAGIHLTGARPAVETVLDRVGVAQLSKVRLTRATGGAGSSETEMVA
jgi:anti-anti-sigma regulatory factor